MPVSSYELDREVFIKLERGKAQLGDWKGAASGIADYVASWGIERFWAMSRSARLLGGQLPDAGVGTEEERRYFAWSVARAVLCQIVGGELGIRQDMTSNDFQARFRQLDFNEQVLLTELLMEIADTVQFWTMRLDDANDAHTSA